ncbi:rod-determining factor RdfA [Halorubrum sp. HHNYT27]|uniref:rod-determining factor RdfA n=1 Tax=Halorubrum sp. HHNYT27 TaxID=3402275 RepID=UPI003EBC2548
MTHSADRCSCKVGRMSSKYDFDGMNEELRDRRLNRERSLRDLADYFNQRVLRGVISGAGFDLEDVAYGSVSPEDAVASVYESLTSETISADREVRVRTRLEQRGIDIDAVESDWVTHPTMQSHLNDCLGIDTSRSSRIGREVSRDTIEWARTRCTKIVDQTVSRLVSSGVVSVSDHTVSVSITISCSDCDQSYRLSELLNERSCACYNNDE